MPAQTFAYLRVSKLDQDLEKNKLDILKLAHESVHKDIFRFIIRHAGSHHAELVQNHEKGPPRSA